MLCHQARNAHPLICSVICHGSLPKARPSGSDLNPRCFRLLLTASQSSVRSEGLNGVLAYGGLPSYPREPYGGIL